MNFIVGGPLRAGLHAIDTVSSDNMPEGSEYVLFIVVYSIISNT